MKTIGIVVLTLILMSFECTRDTEDPVVNQDILFARIYENFAWGHSLEGWYIDNAGNVRGFSLSRNPSLDWNPMHDGGFITEDRIGNNLAQCDTTYFRVPLPDLFNNYALIPEAAKGTLTEKESQGADMGQVTNYCLVYFPDEKQYKYVLLDSRGDWVVRNISPSAARISSWLNEISHQLSETGAQPASP